jgi:hypothetical protein
MISRRSNTGGLVGGSILIGLGALFLLAQFFGFAAWAYVWPLAIVGLGLLFFIGMLAGGKTAGGLAVPGTILSSIGLVLLFQNITGHWETWSYGWTIIVLAVGVGLFIAGAWSGNLDQRHSGLRVAEIGFVLFVLFGAFFELVLGGFGGSRLQQAAFPVLLILIGLYLVLRRSGLWQLWAPPQNRFNPDTPAAERPPLPPEQPRP